MASDDIVCQLCGVAFAIGRLRCATEPTEAAWDFTGHWHVNADTYDLCEEGSGCEIIERDLEGRSRSNILEHISGPGCISRSGYSGQRISLKEMKGCRSIQCLVQKEPDWEPQPDDQDFELESDYFLTGVGCSQPDRGPLNISKTARHGADNFYLFNLIDDNFVVGTTNYDTIALPFHPACFEIFKKVSQLRLGNIDVEGLWYWRALEGTYEGFFVKFPRDFAVRTVYNQGTPVYGPFWQHEPGSEYLVANPIEIPGFSALLKNPTGSVGYRGSNKFVFYRHSQKLKDPKATNHDAPLRPKSLHSTDPFMKLSAELSDMVLACLSSKDIANLRLASSVFRQLPTILFRRLLLEEMPWFWEARGMPLEDTNWYDVYRKVKSCWLFKGLQNRKRIWKDVEEVVRRIGKYRQEGKVGCQVEI
ncbi:hypothetical protein MMC27_003209 [Xylographa pallens]|nr:hypothetical protein [Xylographa pallens]